MGCSACSASFLRRSPTSGDVQVTREEKMRDGRSQVGVPGLVLDLRGLCAASES